MLLRPGSVGRPGQPARSSLTYALDATGEQIRAAIRDVSKYASGGFLLPGTAGARINANARSSVAMERQADGTYAYAPHSLVRTDLSGWTVSGVTVSGAAGAWTLTKNDASGSRSIYSTTTASGSALIATRIRLRAGTLTNAQVGTLASGWGSIASTVISGPGSVSGMGGLLSVSGLSAVTPTDVILYYRDGTANPIAYIYPGGSGTGNAGGTLIVEDVVVAMVGSTSEVPIFVPPTTAALFMPATSYDSTHGWGVHGEAARTNLALWNADMSQSAYLTVLSGSKVGAATALGAVPMYRINVGTHGGGTLVNRSGVYQNLTVNAATTYTMLVLVRAVSGTSAFSFVCYDSGVTTVGSGDLVATTTPQVFAFTWTTAAGSGFNAAPALRAATAGGTVGDIEVGGFSVIAGSVPATESIILTFGSSVTRAADDPLTPYTPGSSGAVIIDYVPLDSSSHVVASLSDGTSNERHTVTNDGVYTVVDGGATQASPDGGTPTVGALNKIGFAFAANDFAVSLNGAAPVTDTSGTLPTVTQLSLAGGPKRVRRVRVMATKPSNLQGMTA